MSLAGDRSAKSRSSSLRPRLKPTSEDVTTALRVQLERVRTDVGAGRKQSAAFATEQLLVEIAKDRAGTTDADLLEDLAIIEASALSLRAQLADAHGKVDDEQTAELQQAADVLHEATDSGRASAHVWADYGAVLDILGDSAQAEHALTQAIRLGEVSRGPVHRLARLRLAAGRPEDAESVLRSLLGRDGESEDPTTMSLLGDSLRARGDVGAYDAYLAAARLLLATDRLDQIHEVARSASTVDPTRVEIQLVMVDALRLRADFTGALATIDEVLALDGSNEAALAAKADVFRVSGDTERALEALELLLARHPTDPFALGMKADVLRMQGRFDEALALLEMAISNWPDDPWTLGTRGQVLRALKRVPEARADLQAALALTEEMPWVAAELAALEYESGERAEAGRLAAMALEKEPPHYLALAVAGWLQHDDGDIPACHATFEKLVEVAPWWADGWAALAGLQLEIEHKGDAAASIRHALELDPDDDVIAGIAVEILLINGEAQDALQLIDAFGSRTDPPPWTRMKRPAALRQSGDLEGALELLRVDLRGDPDDSIARWELARTLDDLQRWDEALTQYAEALRAEPEVLDLRREVADLQYRLGRYSEAAATLSVADVEHGSLESAEDLVRLGEALRLSGEPAEARVYFMRALSVNPKEADAITGLMYAYLDLDKPVQARDYADQVLSVRPSDPAIMADVALVDEAEHQLAVALDRTAAAMEIGADVGWVRYVRGRILNRVGEWEDAATVLRPLRDAGAASPILHELGWALECRALHELVPRYGESNLLVGGNALALLAESQDSYAGALDLEPSNRWCRRGLADTLSLQGDVEKARAHFETIVRELVASPEYSAPSLGLLAWCHYSLGNLESAVPLFISAVSTDTPDTAYLHFDLGLALYAGGQSELAESSYRRGIAALRASDPHVARARVLVARNDLVAAQLQDRIAPAQGGTVFDRLGDWLRSAERHPA